MESILSVFIILNIAEGFLIYRAGRQGRERIFSMPFHVIVKYFLLLQVFLVAYIGLKTSLAYNIYFLAFCITSLIAIFELFFCAKEFINQKICPTEYDFSYSAMLGFNPINDFKCFYNEKYDILHEFDPIVLSLFNARIAANFFNLITSTMLIFALIL